MSNADNTQTGQLDDATITIVPADTQPQRPMMAALNFTAPRYDAPPVVDPEDGETVEVMETPGVRAASKRHTMA